MNTLNIMWLLNDITCNTDIDIRYVKTKSTDWIEIETSSFVFYVDECGTCKLTCGGDDESSDKDREMWFMVKDWVKKYYKENF